MTINMITAHSDSRTLAHSFVHRLSADRDWFIQLETSRSGQISPETPQLDDEHHELNSETLPLQMWLHGRISMHMCRMQLCNLQCCEYES